VILSINKGANALQCYLVMDLIKHFWYLTPLHLFVRALERSRKSEQLVNFPSRFRSECKLILYLTKMYILFCLSCDRKKSNTPGGGSRREPSTKGKQLINFITCSCESSAPFFVIYQAGCEPTPYW
jgi:hypothetical protein